MSEWLTVISLSVLAATIWWGFLFVIPWVARSLFRYKLWQIRDGLMDAIFSGEVPRNEAAYQLKEHIEDLIRGAKEITLLNILSVGVLLPGELGEALESRRRDRQEKEEDWQRISPYLNEVGNAAFIFMLLGSPSGWMGTLILGVGFGWKSLRARMSPLKLAKIRTRHIRVELATSDRLHELWEDRDRDRPLEAYAG